MTVRALAWKADRTTGITGTGNWTFTPFDFSTFGFANLVRMRIEFDLIAASTNDTTGTYVDNYRSLMTYTYKSTGLSVINANAVEIDTGVNVNWVVGSASIGPYVYCEGIATSNTLSIVGTARILNCAEY